ncbi:MAG: class I SAM-dependent methyltransferase [Planctomycetota bacterium]
MHRLNRRHTPQQGQFDFVTVPELPDVPGAIAPSEERYLYWLVRETYLGEGAVVEVGSWLGRSSLRLAAGLRDAGSGGTLYCFDRFRWYRPVPGYPEMRPGADTSGLVREAVSAVHADVVICKTEIKDLRWRHGPVEILFLDAPKAHGTFLRCLQEFGPRLTPGVSFIASQDFAFPSAFAQVLCLGRLGAELEMVHATGNLAGFAVRKKLPAGRKLRRLLDLRAFGAEESLRIWQASLDRLESETARTAMRPGICMHLYAMGMRGQACEMIREMEFTKPMLKVWDNWARRKEMVRDYSGLFAALGLPRFASREDRGEGNEC